MWMNREMRMKRNGISVGRPDNMAQVAVWDGNLQLIKIVTKVRYNYIL